MTPKPPGTVFVERRTYRRRRLADAASMLPLLGIALFGIPLLWYDLPEAPARTTTVMLYVFGIWAVLIALSALVSRDLMSDPAQDPGAEDDTPHGDA